MERAKRSTISVLKKKEKLLYYYFLGHIRKLIIKGNQITKNLGKTDNW